MDKVRFTVGDEHVWQGFHDKDDMGMIGALVFVTADTLRRVSDHIAFDLLSDEWQRVHNGPSEDWATLAFGDSGTILSPVDGMTPLYRLTTSEAVIVQRYDSLSGRTYDIVGADGVTTKGFFGAWHNEDTIDGIDGYETAPADFVPVTHGFYIDAKDVADGRSDAPLIDTQAARDKRETDEANAQACGEPDGKPCTVQSCPWCGANKPGKVWVTSIKVEMSDGTDFEVTQSPLEHEGGTAYSGKLIPEASELEDVINTAINELNLYPERAEA